MLQMAATVPGVKRTQTLQTSLNEKDDLDSIINGENSIPKDDNDDDDASSEYYAQVIPIKAYNDVLDCMKKEKLWKEAVRCLRWMESGPSAKQQHISSHLPPNSDAGDNSIDNIIKPYGFIIPPPTLATYHAVIECCLAAQQTDQAVQILLEIPRSASKLIPKTSTFQIVLTALSKKLQWRKALQLLDTMVELNVPRTVVTYNTIISACARAREVGMAKNLLSRMRTQDGLRPDEISYNSVIGACANTARWKEALALLDKCYREPGVTPNIYIYTNAMR
jgi:pentatricopeptide repeat protein